MLIKKRYSIKDLFLWSRWETSVFLLYSTAITVLYYEFDFTFLSVPWTPVALIGTAVAFLIGFQNNSAYDRIWEARKIWSSIKNTSRSFGMKVQVMITNEYAKNPVDEAELMRHKKTIIYRHIAWVTTLRYAMRQKAPWESFSDRKTNREWQQKMCIPEFKTSLEEELDKYISKEEKEYIFSKGNRQAALLYLQSRYLSALKERGLIWEFAFLELEKLLKDFFEYQGGSERIKGFPYPRQYASLSHYLVIIFLVLLPFGIVPEFAEMAASFKKNSPLLSTVLAWIAIPFCGVVSWAFHILERMAKVGENPFEGSANDVPISTIARSIEIDLREMLDETPEEIPAQFPELYNVQM